LHHKVTVGKWKITFNKRRFGPTKTTAPAQPNLSVFIRVQSVFKLIKPLLKQVLERMKGPVNGTASNAVSI